MKVDLSQAVVVFDLDDTLYPEWEYQTSGIEIVASELLALRGIDSREVLLRWRDAGEKNLWGMLCQKFQFDSQMIPSLLWIYRLHYPKIHLTPEIKRTLMVIEEGTHQVAVLTDGRSVTQRKKLKALGLSQWPAYISEEWNSSKPESLRFRQIMLDYPAKHYIYVGDNPIKDFLAPNQLGWLTIGVEPHELSVHKQPFESLSAEHYPSRWIPTLNELMNSLC